MKTKTIKTISFILVIVMILTVSGCFYEEKNQTEYKGDKLVMTYVSAPLNVPSILDKEQGHYKKAFQNLGFDLEYSNLTSGADQVAALASGDIQILNAIGGSSVLLAASNGADIVILSMYSRAPKAFCMFSNNKSIDSPDDLKGLTIAGPKGTILHELLVAYLSQANLTIDDVKFVDMDISSAIAALESNSIDICLAGGPAAYNCEKSGKHKVTDGEGLVSASVCTAVSKKFAKENPKIIKAFLDTQKSIIDYMNDEKEETLNITAESLDMDMEALKEMYVQYDFSIVITEKDISDLQDTENFLYNSKMIENHVDVNELIYNIGENS